MKFSRLERLYQTPKKWKLAFQKVQAFKFILQNTASKLRLFQTSIFKFYLLSTISALLLPTCSTSSFQKLVEKVRNYIKEVWLIFKKWVWRVDFERLFLVKWVKTNAFSSIGKMKADKTAKSFPTYRILVFSKFDSLDPIYQTSKKREFDRLEKPLWNIKSFISPESSRTRCKLKLVLKFRVFMM